MAHLLRACSEPLPLFLWVICLFFGIDLLKLFISPALKHPHPSTRSSGSACGQRGGGAEPSREFGFLRRNVLMRRQRGLPQIPVVGHRDTPASGHHHIRKAALSESPRKKGWGGGFADARKCLQNTVRLGEGEFCWDSQRHQKPQTFPEPRSGTCMCREWSLEGFCPC